MSLQFEIGQTVTRGIVSAASDRSWYQGEDFIQTDALINPGNPGGALVSLRGELVGFNNRHRRPKGNVGIGFAMHCAPQSC